VATFGGGIAAILDRETLKGGVRTSLHRLNLDLVRYPFTKRVAQTISWLGLDTVIDVGANVGQYAAILRASGFRGRIISCEPMSREFAQLHQRCSKDPAWTGVRAALGAEPGELEIRISANSWSSSLLPMARAHLDAAPDSVQCGRETVPVTTLAELLPAHRIDPRTTLLKVDTQGYEAHVLAGAGELLAGFPAVQLELSFVPLYEGQQLADDLICLLAEHGFRMHALESGFADPRTGRMLQADGLFVRDSAPVAGTAPDGTHR